MTVAPKNPALALVAAFFVPGLGTMINGQVGKGVGILVGSAMRSVEAGILVGYVISMMLTLVLIGFVGVFGFWVWGMVDAYSGAKRWNAAHGIIS